MTEATIAITAGSGTLLRTDTKSISSNTVHREFMLIDDTSLVCYFAAAMTISNATANDHILQLMAGASLNLRIRRVRVSQVGNATTGSAGSFQLVRLTTAGTGGTSVTPAKFDTADGAAGATAMTLPTAKGTESTIVMQDTLTYRQTVATAGAQQNDRWEWVQLPGLKPIIIAAGTSNGIALKHTTAIAGSSLNVLFEFTETSYV